LQVTRTLGQGEFAKVYECRRDGEGEVLALKAIKKAIVERHASNSILKAKRNIGRVGLEVGALRRFRHAGICQLHDVMQSSMRAAAPSLDRVLLKTSHRYLYLVLERGQKDLFSFLDAYPRGCDAGAIINIARITALALRHAHRAGIAHRDVKPENILVVGGPADWARAGDAGIVKLCDFGLCADISSGEMLTDFVRGARDDS